MKLSVWHNSLILKDKCAFIWCSYHFNIPFCVFFLVSSVKKINFTSKGKKICFLHILCRTDIYFKRLVSYQSGITMTISNTLSVRVLSNLQIKLIFSVLKESCKKEYICPSEICPSHIIASSSITSLSFP